MAFIWNGLQIPSDVPKKMVRLSLYPGAYTCSELLERKAAWREVSFLGEMLAADLRMFSPGITS